MLNNGSDVYTSLLEAKEEVHRRWNNGALRSCVIDFVGEMPEVLTEKPRAVLFRHIITPNREYEHFLSIVNNIGIKPRGWEFIEDRFCTHNVDKVGLIKMAFLQRRNGKEYSARYRRICDLTTSDNRKLIEIKTFGDELLIEFHRRLLKGYAPSIEIFDASTWFRSHGNKAKDYYQYFIALFICHGILFENFITNEEEERFFRIVVYPAFKQVVNHFGMKPLIVPIVPHNQASDIYWRSYASELETEVLKCLTKVKGSADKRQILLTVKREEKN